MFGTTKITARGTDGEKLNAKVYIDGKYRGKTPLDLRLGPGTFTIEIEAPDGYRAGEAKWVMFTTGLGKKIKGEMEPVESGQ